MPKSTVTRVNDILRKQGRTQRLVRGRGYYYVTGVAVSSSLYVYHLGPKDFRLALDHVTEVLANEDRIIIEGATR